ncbi:hypothetical protein [Streptomyces sp. NPDC086519]|uniref:hypothetical protein n=1 Tax=Streptomyces sp. NPDC086519 TaxID=3154863 RepID=UPI0034413284
MSDALQKAIDAATEAASETERLEVMRAAVIAQAVAQGLQAMQTQNTQPAAPQKPFDARKWVVIGGVVVSVGLVGSLFAAALALVAVAVAVGGTCATACLMILRSMWRDLNGGK